MASLRNPRYTVSVAAPFRDAQYTKMYLTIIYARILREMYLPFLNIKCNLTPDITE